MDADGRNREKWIIYRGVLNDDFVSVEEPTEDYPKWTYLITVYTYRNAWANNETSYGFESLEDSLKWYRKQYKDRCIAEGREFLEEWREEDGKKGSGEFSDAEALEAWDSYAYDIHFEGVEDGE